MKTIDDYIGSLKQGGKSPATLRTYRKDCEKLVNYFNIKDAKDIENISVSQYLEFYDAQNLSPNSVKGLIRNLSAWMTWLKRGHHIEKTNFSDVFFGNARFPKVVREPKMVLNDEEIEKLIKAGRDIQTRFMIAVLAYCGLRRAELCSIKLSDINGCKIRIEGKGRKIRHTFLNETLCTMLSIYMAQRETDSPYLFYSRHGESSDNGKLTGQSVYNRILKAGKESGISEDKVALLTPHRLRGSLATKIIKSHGLDSAARVLGHSSTATTLLYDSSGDDLVEQILRG